MPTTTDNLDGKKKQTILAVQTFGSSWGWCHLWSPFRIHSFPDVFIAVGLTSSSCSGTIPYHYHRFILTFPSIWSLNSSQVNHTIIDLKSWFICTTVPYHVLYPYHRTVLTTVPRITIPISHLSWTKTIRRQKQYCATPLYMNLILTVPHVLKFKNSEALGYKSSANIIQYWQYSWIQDQTLIQK